MNAGELEYRVAKLEKCISKALTHTTRIYLENHTQGYARSDLDHDAVMAHASLRAAQMNLEDVTRTLRGMNRDD